MPDLADFNTVKQVAEYLNLPRGTLYDIVEAGRIGHIRLSERVIRIRREDVLAYLEANTHEPKEMKK